MILELVGLPGAGKTTYARQLCNSQRYTRVRITSVWELCWYNFLFAVRFPLTNFRLLLWCFRFRGPRALWYTKFTSVYLDYNAKYMKARRYQHTVLDQGHLQVFLSLFESTLPEAARHRLLRLLPKADHYVFFAISEATRHAQLGDRGYASRQGLMSDSLRTAWQKTAAEHFNWLQASVSALAPATIDTVTEETDREQWVSRYETAKFFRYITFARMPTEKAHGLQIATMCTELQKLGHFVSLITPRRSNPITESVTAYYSLSIPLQHRELHVPDIIGWFTRVTSVHHYLHELFFAIGVLFMRIPTGMTVYTRTALVTKVAAWRRRHVVAEVHYWPARGQRLVAWLYRGATALVANSEGTRDAMMAAGLSAIVAHNGFPEEWLNIDIDTKEAQRKLGITTELPVVMYVGSLGKWKGVDTLCEAALQLVGTVQVVVVGGSDTELTSWRDRYHEVIFTGARPYADLGWIQKAADILVVPNNPHSDASERYTSPIKLFAHLASGRPVIVSDLPPLRAIVDEQSVWFFEAGNASNLCCCISRVLSDDEKLVTQKVAKSYNLSKKYSWGSRAATVNS